jgi:hypothetical protein
MSSFTCKTEKFLRWLSKNQYKIYSSATFNDFASVFKSNLRISHSGHFLIKFPFAPFVLEFYEYIPIHKYESLNATGLCLMELGIPFVVIHDCTIEGKDAPSVLSIRVDRLKDRTDVFTEGGRIRKFYFEDTLWRRCLEIEEKNKGRLKVGT